MTSTEYDGKRVLFKGKHPHTGEAGTILGADKTIVGWGYVVQLDNGERCFLFKPGKEADIMPEADLFEAAEIPKPGQIGIEEGV